MQKQSTDIQFAFPLNKQGVRDCKIITEHYGELHVSGKGYCTLEAGQPEYEMKFSADVDFVTWNGTDIRNVLEVMGMMDEINQAAVQHAEYAFMNTPTVTLESRREQYERLAYLRGMAA